MADLEQFTQNQLEQFRQNPTLAFIRPEEQELAQAVIASANEMSENPDAVELFAATHGAIRDTLVILDNFEVQHWIEKSYVAPLTNTFDPNLATEDVNNSLATLQDNYGVAFADDLLVFSDKIKAETKMVERMFALFQQLLGGQEMNEVGLQELQILINNLKLAYDPTNMAALGETVYQRLQVLRPVINLFTVADDLLTAISKLMYKMNIARSYLPERQIEIDNILNRLNNIATLRNINRIGES